jgi:hypothetical protein
MGCRHKIPFDAKDALQRLVRGSNNQKELQVHDHFHAYHDFQMLLWALGPKIDLLSIHGKFGVHYTKRDIEHLASRCARVVGLYLPIALPDGVWDTQNPYNKPRHHYTLMECLQASVS